MGLARPVTLRPRLGLLRLGLLHLSAFAAALAVACGGSEFTAASPADGGAGAPDSGADTGTGDRRTRCGSDLSCSGAGGQQGTICCLPPPPAAPACAAAACGCNGVQLDCWRDSDCPASTPICCLQPNPSCSNLTTIAQCVPLGQCTVRGDKELCDPNDPQACRPLSTCSEDVSCTTLPPNQGYGICSGC